MDRDSLSKVAAIDAPSPRYHLKEPEDRYIGRAIYAWDKGIPLTARKIVDEGDRSAGQLERRFTANKADELLRPLIANSAYITNLATLLGVISEKLEKSESPIVAKDEKLQNTNRLGRALQSALSDMWIFAKDGKNLTEKPYDNYKADFSDAVETLPDIGELLEKVACDPHHPKLFPHEIRIAAQNAKDMLRNHLTRPLIALIDPKNEAVLKDYYDNWPKRMAAAQREHKEDGIDGYLRRRFQEVDSWGWPSITREANRTGTTSFAESLEGERARSDETAQTP